LAAILREIPGTFTSGRKAEWWSLSIIGWTEEAEQRYNNLGGLQEGWPSPCFNGPSWDCGRQAGSNLLHECGCQAGRVGQVDGRAVEVRD